MGGTLAAAASFGEIPKASSFHLLAEAKWAIDLDPVRTTAPELATVDPVLNPEVSGWPRLASRRRGMPREGTTSATASQRARASLGPGECGSQEGRGDAHT